jgi:hypothetical protein
MYYFIEPAALLLSSPVASHAALVVIQLCISAELFSFVGAMKLQACHLKKQEQLLQYYCSLLRRESIAKKIINNLKPKK